MFAVAEKLRQHKWARLHKAQKVSTHSTVDILLAIVVHSGCSKCGEVFPGRLRFYVFSAKLS